MHRPIVSLAMLTVNEILNVYKSIRDIGRIISKPDVKVDSRSVLINLLRRIALDIEPPICAGGAHADVDDAGEALEFETGVAYTCFVGDNEVTVPAESIILLYIAVESQELDTRLRDVFRDVYGRMVVDRVRRLPEIIVLGNPRWSRGSISRFEAEIEAIRRALYSVFDINVVKDLYTLIDRYVMSFPDSWRHFMEFFSREVDKAAESIKKKIESSSEESINYRIMLHEFQTLATRFMLLAERLDDIFGKMDRSDRESFILRAVSFGKAYIYDPVESVCFEIDAENINGPAIALAVLQRNDPEVDLYTKIEEGKSVCERLDSDRLKERARHILTIYLQR